MTGKDGSLSSVRKRSRKILASSKDTSCENALKSDYDKRYLCASLHARWTFIISLLIRSLSPTCPFFEPRIHTTTESLLSYSSGFQNYRGLLNNCIVLLVSKYTNILFYQRVREIYLLSCYFRCYLYPFLVIIVSIIL